MPGTDWRVGESSEPLKMAVIWRTENRAWGLNLAHSAASRADFVVTKSSRPVRTEEAKFCLITYFYFLEGLSCVPKLMTCKEVKTLRTTKKNPFRKGGIFFKNYLFFTLFCYSKKSVYLAHIANFNGFVLT